jgi:hypothetical protein
MRNSTTKDGPARRNRAIARARGASLAGVWATMRRVQGFCGDDSERRHARRSCAATAGRLSLDRARDYMNSSKLSSHNAHVGQIRATTSPYIWRIRQSLSVFAARQTRDRHELAMMITA